MRTEALIDRELDNVLAALTPANALVCQVSLHTGLRVSDVLKLKTAELAPRMWVMESKTKKKKQIGLPGPLLEAIKAQAGTIYAFPSRDGTGHRTRQAVWADCKRAARAFRLPQNVGAHSMRKTYAADVMAAYGDIERVRKALNHSSQSVTMLYLIAANNVRTQAQRPRPVRFRRR